MASGSPFALLLDNDLFFIAKVRETLRHAGYETRVVRRAEDFAQTLAEAQPAVALVNTQARGVDWQAAIVTAREMGIPVIAFGAHVDVESQQAARAAGATRVISNSRLASDLPRIVTDVVARRMREPGQHPAGQHAAGQHAAGQQPSERQITGQD